MKANEISKIINNYETNPYNCVFFDGAWGIGKTYAAKHTQIKDSVWVSLCGIRSAEELYDELNDSFISKKGITNIINKTVKVTADAISSISTQTVATGIVSGALNTVISSKTLLRTNLLGIRKQRVVIIDDFERVSDEIDISEVFHVIDFLASQRLIKIFILGNLMRLNPEIKKKYELYAERYIDKTYHIDEYAEKINWDGLGIDKEFINDFRSHHSEVKNLRSIIKAQQFYDDVKFQLKDFIRNDKDGEQFWTELRLTAFSVVIESIDNIYKPHDELHHEDSNESPQEQAARLLDERIASRIYRHYLLNTQYGNPLCPVLLEYYQNNVIDLKTLQSIYQQTKDRRRILLFLSDEEIVRKYLPQIINKIQSSDSLDELITNASDYAIYCDIIKADITDGISKFRERLVKILSGYVSELNIDIYNTHYYDFCAGNDDVKKIVDVSFAKAKKDTVCNLVKHIGNGILADDSFEMSKKLVELDCLSEYRTLLLEKYNDLLSVKSFPVDIKTENQYYASKNILKVLYDLDSERLQKYYDELMTKVVDLMAKHRCKCIMDEVMNK